MGGKDMRYGIKAENGGGDIGGDKFVPDPSEFTRYNQTGIESVGLGTDKAVGIGGNPQLGPSKKQAGGRKNNKHQKGTKELFHNDIL